MNKAAPTFVRDARPAHDATGAERAVISLTPHRRRRALSLSLPEGARASSGFCFGLVPPRGSRSLSRWKRTRRRSLSGAAETCTRRRLVCARLLLCTSRVACGWWETLFALSGLRGGAERASLRVDARRLARAAAASRFSHYSTRNCKATLDARLRLTRSRPLSWRQRPFHSLYRVESPSCILKGRVGQDFRKRERRSRELATTRRSRSKW